MYHEMKYRVPYADTDQMGVVYYANYLEYFERSRTEMLRAAGLPYSELERQGIILPVSEVEVKYSGSAHYDEMLTFRSYIEEFKGVRLRIVTEVRLEERLLVKGAVVLACVNRERKVCRPPENLAAACRRFQLTEVEQ